REGERNTLSFFIRCFFLLCASVSLWFSSFPGCWSHLIARLEQHRRQTVRLVHGLFGIDLCLSDGGVPVALPVTWRQHRRIESQLPYRFLFPADFLEQGRQLAPGQTRGHDGTIFLLQPASDKNVKQTEEAALGLAVLLERRQELLYAAHSRGSASD